MFKFQPSVKLFAQFLTLSINKIKLKTYNCNICLVTKTWKSRKVKENSEILPLDSLREQFQTEISSTTCMFMKPLSLAELFLGENKPKMFNLLNTVKTSFSKDFTLNRNHPDK